MRMALYFLIIGRKEVDPELIHNTIIYRHKPGARGIALRMMIDVSGVSSNTTHTLADKLAH